MIILQLTIDILKSVDSSVHAIVDLDTGRIGFVEVKGDVQTDRVYAEAPKEWKGALLGKLEPLAGKKPYTNFRITRNAEL